MFGKKAPESPLAQKRPAAESKPMAPPLAAGKPAAPSAGRPAPSAGKGPGLPGPKPVSAKLPPPVAGIEVDQRSDEYYQVKTSIFSTLIDTIDLAQLAQLDAMSAREEI